MVSAARRALAALALLVTVSSEAGAGTPTERLDSFFSKLGDILGGIEAETDFHDRLPVIRRHIADIFDARAAAERVLGREWQTRTPAEQEEFVALFSGLLERAFLARIGSNVDVMHGVRCRYLTETVDGDRATVVVAMNARGGIEMPIEFRMVNRNERWGVSDVVVDGVSLVANYAAQFSRVLGIGPYSELVTRMRTKVSNPPAVVAAPAPGILMPPRLPPAPAHAMPVAAPPPAVRAAVSPPASVTVEPPASIPPAPAATAPPVDRSAPQNERVAAIATSPPREPARSPAVVLRQPPAPDPAPSARRAPSYWVQVGAFKSADVAVRFVSRLGPEDIVIVTEPPSGNGRATEPLFRVRVGPFADHASAIAKLRELRRSGFDPFVVSER